MSPLLREKEPPIDTYVKFVDDDHEVAWDRETLTHAEIAEAHGLGVAVGALGDLVRRIVDDAGSMVLRGNKTYGVMGQSGTCRSRGSLFEARNQTLQDIKKITKKRATKV